MWVPQLLSARVKNLCGLMTRREPSRNEHWKGFSSLSSHLQLLEGKGPQTCSDFFVFPNTISFHRFIKHHRFYGFFE